MTPTTVLGRLFGHRDYPAMVAGPHVVAGECWRFDAAQMLRVLATLDEIEQTGQPGVPNLYDRVVVELPGLGSAFAYHYATDPLADGFVEILPVAGGQLSWGDRSVVATPSSVDANRPDVAAIGLRPLPSRRCD